MLRSLMLQALARTRSTSTLREERGPSASIFMPSRLEMRSIAPLATTVGQKHSVDTVARRKTLQSIPNLDDLNSRSGLQFLRVSTQKITICQLRLALTKVNPWLP